MKKVHSDNPWDILMAAFLVAPSVLSSIAAAQPYWVDVFRKALHAGDEQGVTIALRIMKEQGMTQAAFDAIKGALRTYDVDEV